MFLATQVASVKRPQRCGVGTTILLVEQNVRIALRVVHRGCVIQTGRIVLRDADGELLRSDLVRKTHLGKKTR